jgi:hypothetical protein
LPAAFDNINIRKNSRPAVAEAAAQVHGASHYRYIDSQIVVVFISKIP